MDNDSCPGSLSVSTASVVVIARLPTAAIGMPVEQAVPAITGESRECGLLPFENCLLPVGCFGRTTEIADT
jgi:hypothetical protein